MFKRLFGREPKPPRQEPAVIENDLGRFVMEYCDDRNTRPAYAYSGFIRWNTQPEDYETSAEVPCDSDMTFSADDGFERLRRLLADAAAVDEKIRKAALEDSVDREDGMVHIWGSSDDFPDGGDIISPEEFVSRLSVAGVYLQDDGSVVFFIDLDDMYTDHALEMTLTAEGNIEDCKLNG